MINFRSFLNTKQQNKTADYFITIAAAWIIAALVGPLFASNVANPVLLVIGFLASFTFLYFGLIAVR